MFSLNDHNIRRRGWGRIVLSIPVIYFQFIPVVLLDLSLSVYQAVCFPLYGIALVDRKKYVRDRRAALPYLSWIEQVNCWYCSYANGVLAYARDIALQTEKMWCPIKNKLRTQAGEDLPHRAQFADYGDADSLAAYYKKRDGAVGD